MKKKRTSRLFLLLLCVLVLFCGVASARKFKGGNVHDAIRYAQEKIIASVDQQLSDTWETIQQYRREANQYLNWDFTKGELEKLFLSKVVLTLEEQEQQSKERRTTINLSLYDSLEEKSQKIAKLFQENEDAHYKMLDRSAQNKALEKVIDQKVNLLSKKSTSNHSLTQKENEWNYYGFAQNSSKNQEIQDRIDLKIKAGQKEYQRKGNQLPPAHAFGDPDDETVKKGKEEKTFAPSKLPKFAN